MEFSPALVRPLFDGLEDVVLVVSNEGVILVANRFAVGELGETIEGRPLRELVPEEQSLQWQELLRTPGTVGQLPLDLRRAKGGRLSVAARALAPFDEAGPRLVIGRDLRPLQAVQKELAAAQVQISEDREHLVIAALAGATAHELNQPLTAILGYAELMRRRVSDGDPLAQSLDLIVEAADRMAGMIKKIGRVSRFETKAYAEDRKIVDLDPPPKR